MPELPEVETIRRGLVKRMIRSVISAIEVRAPKITQGDVKKMIGRRVKSIERHGKLLVFLLDNGTAFTVHLKMTGQLLWQGNNKEAVMGGHPSKGYMEPLPHKHTHVIISFANGSTLFFNDLRKFGRLSYLTPEELKAHTFMNALGPEPLEKDFSLDYLRAKVAARLKLVLKAFLLDQTNIAGLGNIYADESCFRAHLLPTRLLGSLSEPEIKALHTAIIETLNLAIEHGGSSERDYINAIGEKGTYLKVAAVYRRTGLPCVRNDGGSIKRIKLAGRSTHFCPVCQL